MKGQAHKQATAWGITTRGLAQSGGTAIKAQVQGCLNWGQTQALLAVARAIVQRCPVHLARTQPLGSRRELPRVHIVESKGLVKAMGIAPGIVATYKEPGHPEQVRSSTHIHKTTMHLLPIHHHSTLSPWASVIKELIHFHFEAHQEGTMSSLEVWRCCNKQQSIAMQLFSGHHAQVMCCHMHPHVPLEFLIAQCVAAAIQYYPCVPPFLYRRHFAAAGRLSAKWGGV